jgi:hypothetical protein
MNHWPAIWTRFLLHNLNLLSLLRPYIEFSPLFLNIYIIKLIIWKNQERILINFLLMFRNLNINGLSLEKSTAKSGLKINSLLMNSLMVVILIQCK